MQLALHADAFLPRVLVTACSAAAGAAEPSWSMLLEAMGDVATRARVLTIGTRIAGGDDMLEVSVADTGAGLGDGAIDHVFEPFYTTKEERHWASSWPSAARSWRPTRARLSATACAPHGTEFDVHAAACRPLG